MQELMASLLQSQQFGGAGDLELYKDFQDVTVGDLRLAVDYLSRYSKDIEMGAEHDSLGLFRAGGKEITPKEPETKPVKGVVIRCGGDMTLHGEGWRKYVEMDVPRDHSIWTEEATGMFKAMGLPLLVQQLPTDPAWKNKTKQHARYDNQAATFMNLDISLASPTWGFAPPQWQSQVGSVLVVRKDKKDISREQVYALAEFFQFHVSDQFEAAMESGSVRERRELIARLLNWREFEAYLEKFKREMLEADGVYRKGWENVKSPFGKQEGS